MRRAIIAGLTATLLAAGAAGYAVADARDLVPGVLTMVEPIPFDLTQMPVAAPAAAPAEPAAPAPEALRATLTPLLASPALGPGAVAIVRDPATGEVLFSEGADRPVVLASLQKLLAAVALVAHLDLNASMKTTVVAGASPGDVVLVAGGDTLLAKGAGDASAVIGHAGLADLAGQVAAAAPPGPLVLRLDTAYATGPRYPATWDPEDVTGGFTRAVSQIGLADLRPVRGRVPAPETDADVLEALAQALRSVGREVRVDPGAAPQTPTSATVLGSVSSASYARVIAHALAESDNAMVENLTRQAMVAARQPVPADGEMGAFVLDALRSNQLPVDQVTITDASGLAPGQSAPLSVVDAVLARGTKGGPDDPMGRGLSQIWAGLPIAGVTGTLTERFAVDDTKPVIGIPRAKTGSLTGVSTLAGTTVDADGRLLLFAVAANKVPGTMQGTKDARIALDRFAAALTRCGCH